MEYNFEWVFCVIPMGCVLQDRPQNEDHTHA